MNARSWFYSQNWHAPARFERPIPPVVGISDADEKLIRKLADEMASEDFDARNPWAQGWLQDENGNMGIFDLAMAAIDEDADAIRAAKDRLRQKYVSEQAHRYRPRAEQKVLHPEGGLR